MKEQRIQIKTASNGYVVDTDTWNQENQRWDNVTASWVCQDLERLIERLREILVPELSNNP